MRKYTRIPLTLPEGSTGPAPCAVVASEVTYGAKAGLAKRTQALSAALAKVPNLNSPNKARKAQAANKLADLIHKATLLHLVSHIHCWEGDFSQYAPGFPATPNWPGWEDPNCEKVRIAFLHKLYDEDVDAIYAQYKEESGLTEKEADDVGKSSGQSSPANSDDASAPPAP